MSDLITRQLGELVTQQKDYNGRLDKRFNEMQRQVDSIDLNGRTSFGGGGGDSGVDNIARQLINSSEFKSAADAQWNLGDRKISALIENPFGLRSSSREFKSVITTTSGITAGTTGITMPTRLPGVFGVARQALRIRDLMPIRQMVTGNAFDFVQQLTRTNNASPQVETSPKAESTYTWNTISDTVKLIANYVNVSRQALDDVPWLTGMLNSELMYGVQLVEETQILSGDGLGQHMKGLITQATAYDTSKNVAGDTALDKLRHATLQARLAGLATFAPDGMVLHPADLARIELIKTNNGGANWGRYIIGDPRGGTAMTLLWGLPVVESDSIAAGTFLVGAFGTAAEIIDRMQARIEISLENGANFTSNVATVLCECRTGLAVMRPGAFIFGSF